MHARVSTRASGHGALAALSVVFEAVELVWPGGAALAGGRDEHPGARASNRACLTDFAGLLVAAITGNTAAAAHKGARFSPEEEAAQMTSVLRRALTEGGSTVRAHGQLVYLTAGGGRAGCEAYTAALQAPGGHSTVYTFYALPPPAMQAQMLTALRAELLLETGTRVAAHAAAVALCAGGWGAAAAPAAGALGGAGGAGMPPTTTIPTK